MPSTPREVLTGVRILACVARADGRLTDDERAALEGAISALPGEIPTLSVSELLASDIDLDLEIAQLLSDESRQQVYEAAMVLATADGEASPQELAMLERLSPLTAEPTMLGQIIGETADTFLPTHISTIHDPEQRTAEVQEDTLKYAILCAGLGAMPIPGASLVTDLLVVALQVKLVRDIACYWGHDLAKVEARALVTSMAGSIGLRIGINSLAKLVPGWGSALGAATSFGSTVAIGRAADAWFSSGAALSPAELRKSYMAGVADGKATFSAQRSRIDAATERNEAALAKLNEQLAGKLITQEAYLRAVDGLR